MLANFVKQAIHSLFKPRPGRKGAEARQGQIGVWMQEGYGLHQQGKFEDAERLYLRALATDPSHADALFLLGKLNGQRGRYLAARDYLERALQLNPEFAEARVDLGTLFVLEGQLGPGEDCYRRALASAPENLLALSNLGNVLTEQEKFQDAAQAYRKLIELDPANSGAFALLAQCLLHAGAGDEARAMLDQALRLQPDSVDALNVLGNLHYGAGDFGAAVAAHRRAAAINPNSAVSWSNLGNALRFQDCSSEALECFRKAIAVQSDFPNAHNNLAILLFTLGRYAEAWPEYEWRRKLKSANFAAYPEPQWDGKEFRSKTLLVHGEQALGDTIMFARFLPQVKALGGEVILECLLPLTRLLGSCAGADRVIERVPGIRPDASYDLWIPLLSLPWVFGTDLPSISACGYIRPAPDLAEKWGNKLSPSHRLKVGLCWAGNLNHPNERNPYTARSAGISAFAPLMAISGVDYYSLTTVETVARAGGAWPVTDLTAEIGDFADTAALIANLDLVISVDTSVAHLAGAMGTKTWILLPKYFDWRWNHHDGVSLWYPSVRCYPQDTPGDWSPVINSIKLALQIAVGEHSAARR